MSNTNFINETTICNYDSGNKSKSDFHNVTIRFRRGLGGIHEDEIEKVKNQLEEDKKNGLFLAGTIGIEGTGEERHIHVSMILATKTESHVTQQRYEQLIDKSRLHFTSYIRDTKDGPKKVTSCPTVKVTQPSKNVIANIRAYTWLSYPLKELAKEFNDIAIFKAKASAGETIRFISYGLGFNLDDADDEFTQRRQDEFFNSIFTTWQKKVSDKSGKKQSLCLGSDILAEQVRVFRKDHNIDMEWHVEDDNEATVKNQATILTKMVLNKLGKKRYVLSKTFFAGSKNGANIYRNLVLKKPADDKTSVSYETALYGAIESHLLTIYSVNISTSDMSKEIKKLKKANEKLLKANQKLKQKFDSLKKNTKDKGIQELLRLQKEEDALQVEMAREGFGGVEGNTADLFTRIIPEVKAMNLDLLTYENSLEDRQKALVERQASSKRKAPDSSADDFDAQPQEKRQKTDANNH